MQDIVLAPLSRDDLEQLIADSLRCEPETLAPLAELIHEKTAGNPFFTIQFISELEEEGLLIFDHVDGAMALGPDRIHAKGYTDNVVDLMVGKLNRLPTETQKALKQLACLGNSADFDHAADGLSGLRARRCMISSGKPFARASSSDQRIPIASSMTGCRKQHTL